MQSLLGALFFGIAGYAGILLAGTLSYMRLPDSPDPGEPPIPWLVAGSAAIGAIVSLHASPSQIVTSAVVCAALAGIWCTDVRYGVVPDALSLGPLAIVLLAALWQHQWALVAGAIIPVIPFAIAALLSKGIGMGWGDVKLAALGGATMGAPLALVMFAAACVAAVAVAFARKRVKTPIAFAPYLACAIAIALPASTLS